MLRSVALVILVACKPSGATSDAAPPQVVSVAPPASVAPSVASSAPSDADARAAKLAAEADAMQLEMLKALGDGTNVGSSELHVPSNGPAPIVTGGGLSGLDAGPPPPGRVSTGASTSVPPIANADRVIAGLRPRARTCYNQGLANDPGMHGVVTIALMIDTAGDVTSANVTGDKGGSVSGSVIQCITRAFKNAQFDPPASAAKLTVALTLAPGP